MVGMLENWRGQVRDIPEQQGTWSGPEGGLCLYVPVAHDIPKGTHWNQLYQWYRWKQTLLEAYVVNPVGGV